MDMASSCNIIGFIVLARFDRRVCLGVSKLPTLLFYRYYFYRKQVCHTRNIYL